MRGLGTETLRRSSQRGKQPRKIAPGREKNKCRDPEKEGVGG